MATSWQRKAISPITQAITATKDMHAIRSRVPCSASKQALVSSSPRLETQRLLDSFLPRIMRSTVNILARPATEWPSHGHGHHDIVLYYSDEQTDGTASHDQLDIRGSKDGWNSRVVDERESVLEKEWRGSVGHRNWSVELNSLVACDL